MSKSNPELMELTKYLKKQNYDLIDGPVRNHKPLQLWVKRELNPVDLYYREIQHAFKSDVQLTEFENTSLSVNSSKKNEYNFNIGLTILEDVLKAMGLGNFEIGSKIKSGKKVNLSYDNAVTKEVALGEISDYLSSADFNHINPVLLNNANRKNILIITGVVFARNLVIEVETDFSVDTNLVAALKQMGEAKVDITLSGTNNLKMVASQNTPVPIAVKAYQLEFTKGVFNDLKPLTDNRDLF